MTAGLTRPGHHTILSHDRPGQVPGGSAIVMNLMQRCRYAALLLFVSLLISMPLAVAADPPAVETTAAAVSDDLRSPRATMATFLHAMNDIRRGDPRRIATALSALDLSVVNPLVRRERGEYLAWTLLEILDRTRRIDLTKVPDRNTGEPWVFERYSPGAISIARQDDGSWLFDAASMARLPEILATIGERARVVDVGGDDSHLPWTIRLQRRLPQNLRDTTFLLENWRWLGLLVAVAAGIFADWLVTWLARGLMRTWIARRRRRYAEVSEEILRPLGLMAMAIIWWLGINVLSLPETALLILLVAVKFLASAAGVWTAYRLVDLVSAWLHVRAAETDNKIDDVLAPLIPRTLKVFVTVVGVVFVANNLSIDVSGLLAGLGLGGLAFALAAKDMVQNLFGSITVLMDRTFTVGDWIVVGGQEGTVERMGFRSTRIRTFYNSLVTVPNSVFITAEVDNMGARRYRRLSTKFGIAYATPPDRIEAFCEGIRELVRQHPYMRKDYYHVYLNGLGTSALEVMVYVFWETPDWSTELRERHRFLLDCLRLAAHLGVEYAFPTQTLYMRQDDGEARPPAPEPTQAEAFAAGRESAQQIFAETNGNHAKPPPVSFSS